MRPELPWNVAGIPPEAREAARAAARREGLSLGEWLTRRILRSFADGAEDEPASDHWSSPAPGTYAPSSHYDDPPRVSEAARETARDAQDLIARLARTEAEAQSSFRRIEEHLRALSRRLETAERNQSETHRSMNKAASEIGIATREQAQAFDQLGSNVVGLAERLDRLERHSGDGTLRDAVRGLHQGLGRLAEQITKTATESSNQIGTLASSLESLAAKFSTARAEADQISRTLDGRIEALGQRVKHAEEISQATATSLKQALQTLETRLAQRPEAQPDAERQSHAIQNIEQTLQQLTQRIAAAESQTSGALARLEELISRNEAREQPGKAEPEGFDRRFSGIETALSAIAKRLDEIEEHSDATVQDGLRTLGQRLETAEKRQRDAFSEMRTALSDAAGRIEALEAGAHAPPPPGDFDLPPFPDAQPAEQSFRIPEPESFAPPPPESFAPGFPQEQAPRGGNDYLTAARRAAQAAAEADVARGGRGPFGAVAWGQDNGAAEDRPGYGRFALISAIGLFIIVVAVAGFMLSQGISFGPARDRPAPSSSIRDLFGEQDQAPPQEDSRLPTTISPAPGERGVEAPAATAATPQAMPHAAAPDPEPEEIETPAWESAPPPPRETGTAKPRVSAPARTAAQKPAVSTANPIDRLKALAEGGDATAQTVLGFKYLDGDGIAASDAEGARWLEAAANKGQATAQYRLGTLYERGRGVAADAVKARRWYEEAAKRGNRKAMHNLAVALAQGIGGDKDYAEAARWFRTAAELGLADSQFNLAVLYERGLGLPMSLIDAYKWYAIAAAQGDSEAKARVQALSPLLKVEERDAADRAARAFKPRPLDRAANVVPEMSEVVG